MEHSWDFSYELLFNVWNWHLDAFCLWASYAVAIDLIMQFKDSVSWQEYSIKMAAIMP